MFVGISASWANSLAGENPCCPCQTEVILPLWLGVTCLQGVPQHRAWGDAVGGRGRLSLPASVPSGGAALQALVGLLAVSVGMSNPQPRENLP